jgi:hypothetical protein
VRPTLVITSVALQASPRVRSQREARSYDNRAPLPGMHSRGHRVGVLVGPMAGGGRGMCGRPPGPGDPAFRADAMYGHRTAAGRDNFGRVWGIEIGGPSARPVVSWVTP